MRSATHTTSHLCVKCVMLQLVLHGCQVRTISSLCYPKIIFVPVQCRRPGSDHHQATRKLDLRENTWWRILGFWLHQHMRICAICFLSWDVFGQFINRCHGLSFKASKGSHKELAASSPTFYNHSNTILLSISLLSDKTWNYFHFVKMQLC